jgi:Leucine-rich repeat (LRR) protein
MLVEINFSGNDLADLPAKMKQLVHLQHLQLCRNRFQFLPEVLAHLGPKLLTLTLAWNSIKDIPEMVRTFSLIEELNLSYNMITSTSNLLQLHTLKALHLASNNLARIVAISKMSSLTVLNLNHNPINYFPASFGNSNNSLKVLSIDSWTRSGLPPCYMPNAEIWLFTPPSSDEVFERPL